MAFSDRYENTMGVRWGSAAFSTKDATQETQLFIRRVKPSDEAEHVQIEVNVRKFGEKRTMTYSGHLHLTPEIADVMVSALSKLHPPHNGETKIDDNAHWATFYGIKKLIRRTWY